MQGERAGMAEAPWGRPSGTEERVRLESRGLGGCRGGRATSQQSPYKVFQKVWKATGGSQSHICEDPSFCHMENGSGGYGGWWEQLGGTCEYPRLGDLGAGRYRVLCTRMVAEMGGGHVDGCSGGLAVGRDAGISV